MDIMGFLKSKKGLTVIAAIVILLIVVALVATLH